MSPGAFFRITIEGETACFEYRGGKNLLAAMERIGKKSIPVGCRGGGCGRCRIRVISGEYHCKKMSRVHVSAEAEAEGFALACRLVPQSDLVIQLAKV